MKHIKALLHISLLALLLAFNASFSQAVFAQSSDEPIMVVADEERGPEKSASEKFLYTISGGAVLLGVLGLLGIMRAKRITKPEDPCGKIKTELELKKNELADATIKFSLQEALVEKLRLETENKKNGIKKNVVNEVKDKVLEAIGNETLTKTTELAEKAKAAYDAATKEHEDAKSLLVLFRTKKEKLTGELGVLESRYKTCLVTAKGISSVKNTAATSSVIVPPVAAKKNLFIFHGTAGSPKENWFPWLKEKMESKGYKVIIPQFPTPAGQSIESWNKVFEEYKKDMNEDTILIGHSLGGMFALRVLEGLPNRIRAAYFVGTPIGIQPILNYTNDYNFGGFAFSWDKIKNKAKNFAVFHSDNDPYVSLENGRKLAKELGAELAIIPGAGHFNTKAGYQKFDQLQEKLEKLG